MWTTLHLRVFTLCELPFTLRLERKKKETGNICKGTPDIEFEQDWSVGLGATLRDRQKIKNYFSSFKDFSGKADGVILLGFECSINTQNFNKILVAIFEKIKFFFLMCTTLNFGGSSKTAEQAEDIRKGTLDIDFERN